MMYDGSQASMSTSIPMVVVVKTINNKATKDEAGNVVPVAQITLVTTDLNAANNLAWHLGAESVVSFEPSQPTLPGVEPPSDRDGYQMSLPPEPTVNVSVPAVRTTAAQVAEATRFTPYEERPSEELAAGQPDGDYYVEVEQTESDPEPELGLCAHGRFKDRGCPDCLDERDDRLDAGWTEKAKAFKA